MRIRTPVGFLLMSGLLGFFGCDRGGQTIPEPPVGSSEGSSAACAPLTVTADGEAVEGLVHGIGYQEASAAYQIAIFNHEGVPCEELMAGVRNVPPGEVAARVWTDGYQATVSLGASVARTDQVDVLTAPEEPGDLLAICIREPVELQGTGPFRDKTVRIYGLFTARFCGRQAE